MIRLERKTRDEPIERFRRRIVEPEAHMLRDRLADWLEPQVDYLRSLRPELPDELDDRAQDIWEPLLAIADLASGRWPGRARTAAVALSANGARDDQELTVKVLRDIHSVFDESGEDRLRTADLIEKLGEIEESPWGDWYGKPISPQALSKLLRPFGIRTMPVWTHGETAMGYKCEQFHDAFARVLGVREVRSGSSSQNGLTEPNSLTLAAFEGVRRDAAPDAAPNPPNRPNPHRVNRANGIEKELTPSEIDAIERARSFDELYPPKGART